MSTNAPWILGIASSHNGGACLIHGTEIVCAIQEERLLRFKRAEHPAASASLAIRYCLDTAGITAADLDSIVVCAANSNRKISEDITLNSLLQVARSGTRVHFVPHHLGHAYAVYALCGVPVADILVIDGNGSPVEDLLSEERDAIVPGQLNRATGPDKTTPREHISLYRGIDGHIQPLEKHIAAYPFLPSNSPGMQGFRTLGDMYGFVGRQIFGSFFDGPGKVMGLAPYGKPSIDAVEFFRINGRGFDFQDTVRTRFEHVERWPARAEEYRDLAASVQGALEAAVLHLVEGFQPSSDVLCYAGGVALNSVANARLSSETTYEDVFIMPAAEDSGTAIGAAFYGLWQRDGYAVRKRQVNDSMGRQYSGHEILQDAQRFPAVHVAESPHVVEEAVRLLTDGKIIGWFQGGSELGPRALGQRSILCDPRGHNMKDILNARVKFREGFRPFAPIVLEEDVYEWFDVKPPHGVSPFMLQVLPLKSDCAGRVPAVVHVDGTGRVQTVSETNSPRLYELLRLFKERTGVPVLLNTSFNIAGEPIVEAPREALWCLVYTDLDACVLGDYVAHKLASDRDPVLDYPLAICARAVSISDYYTKGSSDRIGSDLDTRFDDRIFSVHSSRALDLEEYANRHPWLQVKVTVHTRWGTVIHGLPRDAAPLLTAMDGRRTGRELYQQLAGSTPKPMDEARLQQFKRQLAVLNRIGAIYTVAIPQTAPAPVERSAAVMTGAA
jgi:carbamoyltransferase